MASIRKSRVLFLVCIAATMFITVQFLIYHKLKSFVTDFSIGSRSESELNENRIILSKILKSNQYIQSESTLHSKLSRQRKKMVQFRIPVDSDSNPELINLLPFYNRLNHFNFTSYLVDEPDAYEVDSELSTRRMSTFVGIESENRLIDKSLLKNYEIDLAIHIDLNTIRGINKDKKFLYKPGKDGRFKCLNSNQHILYSMLNDDYCDCVDGTDEPGSSACQFSIFYCSNQNKFLNENYIVSSKVDDKVCDCCDGSDENSSLKCPDTCEKQIAEAKQSFESKKLGQNLKRKYLVDGLLKNEQIYGPKGVFYRLSKSCFEIDWSEFSFQVCPYKKVLQYKRNYKTQSTDLGYKPSLALVETQHGKMWILKMENGDPKFCSQPRRSEIHFICGTTDQLKQVQEPSKCVYEFEMLTPAAC